MSSISELADTFAVPPLAMRCSRMFVVTVGNIYLDNFGSRNAECRTFSIDVICIIQASAMTLLNC